MTKRNKVLARNPKVGEFRCAVRTLAQRLLLDVEAMRAKVGACDQDMVSQIEVDIGHALLGHLLDDGNGKSRVQAITEAFNNNVSTNNRTAQSFGPAMSQFMQLQWIKLSYWGWIYYCLSNEAPRHNASVGEAMQKLRLVASDLVNLDSRAEFDENIIKKQVQHEIIKQLWGGTETELPTMETAIRKYFAEYVDDPYVTTGRVPVFTTADGMLSPSISQKLDELRTIWTRNLAIKRFHDKNVILSHKKREREEEAASKLIEDKKEETSDKAVIE